MPKPPFDVALLLLLISFTPSPAACMSSFVCNLNNYIADDPFAISLLNVFSDLVERRSARSGEDYYNKYDYAGSLSYNRSTCSGNIIAGDCRYCLQSAIAAATIRCYMAIGGQATLENCGLRYEQYEFV